MSDMEDDVQCLDRMDTSGAVFDEPEEPEEPEESEEDAERVEPVRHPQQVHDHSCGHQP